MMSGGFRDLTVYKKAYELAMDIFDTTKSFPSVEKYALVDQLRRSSRSVCRAIAEGCRKRQYPKHFSSKMSDEDMESSETQVSIDFALSCNYISQNLHDDMINKSEEIGRMVNHMIMYPEKYKPRK